MVFVSMLQNIKQYMVGFHFCFSDGNWMYVRYFHQCTCEHAGYTGSKVVVARKSVLNIIYQQYIGLQYYISDIPKDISQSLLNIEHHIGCYTR